MAVLSGVGKNLDPSIDSTEQVLFVGGDPNVIRELNSALNQEPYRIVAVADADAAWEHLTTHRPHVVVADEQLGTARGADFLTEMQKRHPQTVRIMITRHGHPQCLIDAVNRAEIYRFLASPIVPANVARVLREAVKIARVAEAQRAVWDAAKKQRDAMQRLVQPGGASDELEPLDDAVGGARFAGTPGRRSAPPAIGRLPKDHAGRLSAREREIVAALGSGQRVKEIAQELVISTHTVRNHLKAIYRKLNVSSQFELISLLARGSREA